MAAISGTTLLLAAGAAAAGAAAASSMAKKAKLPTPLDPVTSKLERVRAETDVVQKVQSRLAQRNQAIKASTLVADPLGASLPSLGGKTTLGQ